jgi:hypothetical protein
LKLSQFLFLCVLLSLKRLNLLTQLCYLGYAERFLARRWATSDVVLDWRIHALLSGNLLPRSSTGRNGFRDQCHLQKSLVNAIPIGCLLTSITGVG